MIQLQSFFAKPQKIQLRVSPKGKWTAWLARDSEVGVLNIWVQQEKRKEEAKQVSFSSDRDICSLFFFSLDDKYLLFIREVRHASEFYHLHAIDLEALDPWSSCRDLIEDSSMTVAIGFIGGVQIWQPPENPREILIATGRGSLFWDISQINIDTGRRLLKIRNPMNHWQGILGVLGGHVFYFFKRIASFGYWHGRSPGVPAIQWFPDSHRNFSMRGRVEVSLFPHIAISFAVQRDGTQSWIIMQTIKFEDLNMQLLGASGASGTLRMDFSPDNPNIVSVHTCADRDTTSLVQYEITESKFQERFIISHVSKCDLEGFLIHPCSGEVQAAMISYEKAEIIVIDSSIAEDIHFLEKNLPGKKIQITSRTLDDTLWTVFASSDRCPGEYFIYHKLSRELVHAFLLRPDLEGMILAEMLPIHIPARDGEDLLCYLSLPSGCNKKGNGRLVILLHGGPSAQDYWGFDAQVQLLCSRGMTVLQINYRGSTGKGRRFLTLPYGKIETMQQDVSDAARWAIEQGYAQHDKVAIMGASWGGFLTLSGLAFDPNLFACGVAMVAFSTVGAANKSKAFRGDPLVEMYWKKVYGKVANDMECARAVSPLFHVNRIRAPVMLVRGEKDTRVPLEHSDAIVEAMKQKGGNVYFVSYSDEGHGVRKEPNMLDMWSRIEQFLCHFLSLPAPPLVNSEGNSAEVKWDPLGLSIIRSPSSVTLGLNSMDLESTKKYR